MNNQFANIVTLALFTAIAFAGACSKPSGRVVFERTADRMHADLRVEEIGTDAYPRRYLGAETRVTCATPFARSSLNETWLTVDTSLVKDAEMDFGYAVEASGELDVPVYVQVIATNEQRSEVVFESVVGPGGESFSGWHEARVDLAGWAGDVRLDFASVSATEGVDLVTGRFSATVFFSCPVFTGRASVARPLNLILISLDTLRADRLSVYGYDRPTSPNMQRIFGDGGVVVERAYSQGTDTLLGHTAMLFGLNPSVARELSVDSWTDPQPVPSLADLLRAEGYRTAAFTEDGFVAGAFGFENGFELYFEERSASLFNTVGKIEETLDKGFDWIARQKDQPFFVFLHTYQVHEPYEPPESYRKKFEREGDPGRDSDLYVAEIAYTDEVLGRFVNDLDALGVGDETMVIVTSDHGEEFGEHGGRSHGAHLHDEVLRVPMLIRAPGVLPAGVRREGPMALVDIMPTVAELLGFVLPDWGSGRSLADHLRSDVEVTDHSAWTEAWVKSAWTYEGKIREWIPPAYAVTQWPYRVIRLKTPDGARYEAYDLRQDPQETRDLFASGQALPDSVVALRSALAAYPQTAAGERSRLRERFSGGGEVGQGTALDPAVTEKLRALGYLN